MGCLAFIILPFVGAYKFIRWGFTNGVKGYIGLIAAFIVVLVLILVIRSVFLLPDEDPTGLTGIPNKLTAPYQVDTWSRTYYAEEAWEDESGVTMVNYWELRGEEWIYHEEVFPFGENFGDVRITDRR